MTTPSPADTHEPGVTFVTDGLLSKWGFDDGDLLMSFMNANGFSVGDYIHGDLLVAAVRRFVLPRLEQRVEVVSSLHNPIRATSVDGAAIDPYRPEACPVRLRPAEVQVSREDLIALAEEVFGTGGRTANPQS
jgi:hypothetical protein